MPHITASVHADADVLQAFQVEDGQAQTYQQRSKCFPTKFLLIACLLALLGAAETRRRRRRAIPQVVKVNGAAAGQFHSPFPMTNGGGFAAGRNNYVQLGDGAMRFSTENLKGVRLTCDRLTISILDFVDNGARGDVWSAVSEGRQDALDGDITPEPTSVVAIKVYKAGARVPPTFQTAYDECSAMKAVKEAGAKVPQCYAACKLPDGSQAFADHFAIVMDFVQGPRMDRVLDRAQTNHASEEMNMIQKFGARWAEDIVNNIAAFLSAGWIDLDRKPDNTIIAESAKRPTVTFIDLGSTTELSKMVKQIVKKMGKKITDVVEEGVYDKICQQLQEGFGLVTPFLGEIVNLGFTQKEVMDLLEKAKNDGKFDISIADMLGTKKKAIQKEEEEDVLAQGVLKKTCTLLKM